MLDFTQHRLDNGLTVLHHRDGATRMVAVNLLYNVGSSDEHQPLTGIAHLLEHLMFTGSAHVPSYDQALQAAGGESNAWTSVDATNYYDVLPAVNLETALWLESDRLMSLTLSDQSIATQKSVVIEEFKQRCLNMPYGDLNHLVCELAYQEHPYRWPAIGRRVADIDSATADDVRQFHQEHYAVGNAVLCISGNVELDVALDGAKRWFGDIPAKLLTHRRHPCEPEQCRERLLEVSRDVPQTIITRAYHMPGRASHSFAACDILSDVLSNGKSARFYQNAVLPTDLFTELDASVSGTLDPGLFFIRAKLAPGATVEQAQGVIDTELQRLLTDGVRQYELEKFVNKHIAADRFESLGYLQQAMRLCMYHQLGNVEWVNTEEQHYRCLTTDDILEAAHSVLQPHNCSTVIYRSNIKGTL